MKLNRKANDYDTKLYTNFSYDLDAKIKFLNVFSLIFQRIILRTVDLQDE